MQVSIDALGIWFRRWRIKVNPSKSSVICFDMKRRRRIVPRGTPALKMLGTPIPWQRICKHLGVTLDKTLTFRTHITRIAKPVRNYLHRLSPMICRHSKMSLRNKTTLYRVSISPVMSFASAVFAHSSPTTLYTLQTIQNPFCRMATNAPWFVRNADHRDLKLKTVQQYFKEASEKFLKIAEFHENPLIKESINYRPPPSHYSIRRPGWGHRPFKQAFERIRQSTPSWWVTYGFELILMLSFIHHLLGHKPTFLKRWICLYLRSRRYLSRCTNASDIVF